MTGKVHKIFDWRLPFCVALMGLVLYIIVTGLSDARESREKSVRIDALIVEMQHQREAATGERMAASAERARLLDGQSRLERQYQRLARQQAALLSYLRSQGIEIPERFTTLYRVPSAGVTLSPPKKPGKASNPPSTNAPPKATGRNHKAPPKKVQRHPSR